MGGVRAGSIIICGKDTKPTIATKTVVAVSDEEPEKKHEEPESMRRNDLLLRNKLNQQQEFRGFRAAARSADKDELLHLSGSSSSLTEAL